MKSNKVYKWGRGILKASAFASVMFVMQACYGTPDNNRFRYSVTLEGTVTDMATSQPIEGVRVIIDGSNYTTLSDENGNFQLDYYSNRDMEEFYVEFSSSNYKTLDTLVAADDTIKLNVALKAIE